LSQHHGSRPQQGASEAARQDPRQDLTIKT